MNVSFDTVANKAIDEPVTVTDGAVFKAHGIVNGDVLVRDGVFFLHGILNGNLCVSEKSRAFVYGIANADSVEAGGIVDVYGILETESPLGSNVVLHRNCIVNGTRH